MSTFQKVFDMTPLTDLELGWVEFAVTSPAYDVGFRKYITSMRNTMNKMMLDRSQTRKDEYPDDFLAGGIAFGDGLLEYFDRLIQEANMDRINRSMNTRTDDQQYEDKQRAGEVSVVVGVNQDPEPSEIAPAEDY